jgi:tRNA threonylcarbamoyladenosine biosynthesis protein TsaB
LADPWPLPPAAGSRELLLLVMDTATLRGSVAVVAGRARPDEPVPPEVRVLAAVESTVTTHSEMLMGLVAEALRQAAVRPHDCDAVGCGAGPGSFTGLRIGLCTAKGLCLASERPLVMASSLRALALGHAPAVGAEEVAVAVLDARKGEVYGGFFHGPGAEPLCAEVAMSPAAFGRHARDVARGRGVMLCGAGASVCADEVRAESPGVRVVGLDATPAAAELARLCLQRIGRGEVDDLAAAAPTYVRPSEAELKARPKPDGRPDRRPEGLPDGRPDG